MSFQLWTLVAYPLAVFMPTILAKHFQLSGVEVVGMEQPFFPAYVVSIRQELAELVGSEIQVLPCVRRCFRIKYEDILGQWKRPSGTAFLFWVFVQNPCVTTQIDFVVHWIILL